MLNIVIAMAGVSSRFSQAGYTLPKYMLYAGTKSLFRLSVESFANVYDEAQFIFVSRDMFDTCQFIHSECRLMGVPQYKVVTLDETTRGQAESVYLGLQKADVPQSDNLLVFNIDTFRPGFTLPPIATTADGYLEVFKGEGPNWSYARTMSPASTLVVETAEKREISQYCSTGLYYFRRVGTYLETFVDYSSQKMELYVAPMYNLLIHQGKDIHINLINREEVIFCGTPDEYLSYLKGVVL